MNLSFSNIAWSTSQDKYMYKYLQSQGFCGLEIAPTRIFPDIPYEHLDEAQVFATILREDYGLTISSMQSIWYGQSNNIFGSPYERQALIDYTKKAVDFAAVVGCGNLVFGCPKNRNKPDSANIQTAYDFFGEIVEYAVKCRTVIALEPNPVIYGTNFINTTTQAFELAKQIDGLKVNIDFGTIIENCEDLQLIADNIGLVNHIHISEPNLVKIVPRQQHNQLAELLKMNKYSGYVSVEMKKLGNIELVKQTADYVKEVFR